MRIVIMLLGLFIFCSNALAFTQKTADELERTTQRWKSRSDFPAIMSRLERLRPRIDRICKEHGVKPELIYGLIMTESGARSDAVDFLFTNSRSSESHVGLGQLSSSRLPWAERDSPRRIRAARRWQRNQTRTNLKAWARLDSRFNPEWNLEQTIASFATNQKKCGNETLAIMAHHGGSNDPIRRVSYYARDHEGKSIQPHKVSSFVKNRNIGYFTLYEDRSSRGHQYWAQKRESHLTYALAVIAASKAAGYKPLAEKPERTALQEGAKMEGLIHQLSPSVLWNDFVALMGDICSVGWRIALLMGIILVIRHAIPPMTLIFWETGKSFVAALPRVGKGFIASLKFLFGTKRQREAILSQMRAVRKASAAKTV